MWIFTKYGFYSAVCERKSGTVDASRMLVRSRDRRHLENLKTKFNLDCRIRDNEGTDYAYRMTVPKTKWAEILSGLVAEQDYTNFKNEVGKNIQEAGGVYLQALHKVWSVMLDTQGQG